MDLSLCTNARASVVGKLFCAIRVFDVKFIENANVQDIQVEWKDFLWCKACLSGRKIDVNSLIGG